MPRLLIHVEGPTEETFVNEVLRDYLLAKGYDDVGARIMGNARLRRHRGGIVPWFLAKKDIVQHLKEDSNCFATTMVDYYGLPKEGAGAWPGRAAAAGLHSARKAPVVEAGISEAVAEEMGNGFRVERFIPFVVMHEFEGLLFSDCAAFSRGIQRVELEGSLQAIRERFETPEEINDSPFTAPSKRILRLIPEYEKPLLGTLAALEIGLMRMREECPHFDGWLTRLEACVA